MNRGSVWLASGVCVLALTIAGCAGLADYPTAPGSPAPGPAGATVTITSSGLEPGTVTIAVGQSVTFVNSDSVSHEIASDPHPVHNECPSINRVGQLAPGASAQTGALPTARACGYHDALRDGDSRWHGTIMIR